MSFSVKRTKFEGLIDLEKGANPQFSCFRDFHLEYWKKASFPISDRAE